MCQYKIEKLMPWIYHQNKKPPIGDRTNLYWFMNFKTKEVTIGYQSSYGAFDLHGNGIAYTHWMPLDKPKPIL